MSPTARLSLLSNSDMFWLKLKQGLVEDKVRHLGFLSIEGSICLTNQTTETNSINAHWGPRYAGPTVSHSIETSDSGEPPHHPPHTQPPSLQTNLAIRLMPLALPLQILFLFKSYQISFAMAHTLHLLFTLLSPHTH